MEENQEDKELQPKEKKTAKRSTTRKPGSSTKKAETTAKKATKTATTTKKTTSTRKTAGTEKKTSSSTKKTGTRTTKKKTAQPIEETKIEKEAIEPEKKTIVDRIINTEKEKTETEAIEEKIEQTVKPKKTWLDQVELDEPKTSKKERKEKKPKFEKVTPKVEKEKKKTKHPFLRFLLALIVIALILFIAHFVRNYMIFNSLLEKRETLAKSTNHSYVRKIGEETLEYYYKDNTVILITQTAEKKQMLWSDKSKNEIIGIDLKGLTAKVSNGTLQEEAYGLVPSGLGYEWNGTSRMYDCAFWITSDIVDGTDCYKISWIVGNGTDWYDKETGTLMKTEEGGNVAEYTDWEFNKLTDEDMLRPNLMGFQVTDHSNNGQDNNNQNQEDQNNNEDNLNEQNTVNENVIDQNQEVQDENTQNVDAQNSTDA